jgi:molybdopterin converting factor small subunit
LRLFTPAPILRQGIDKVKVTVKLYAVLQIGRFQEKVLSYPLGATVADVVASLELPSEHVDILLINGVHAETGALLNENDVLSVLPMVEGG